jgi:hypothetical protein
MGRVACHFLLALFVLGLPASHFVFSGKPPCPKPINREFICHIVGSEKGPQGKGPVKREKGKLLYISQVAVNHHLKHHRDCAGKDIIRLGRTSCTCSRCIKDCENDYDKCRDACANSRSCISKCKKAEASCKRKCRVN